jgi:hypothetical protein
VTGPDGNGNSYDPSNCWYWAHGGAAVPVGEIRPGYGHTPTDPCWEQLDHLKRLLAEAVAWYERLVALGYDGMPTHMKWDGNPNPAVGEVNNWHVGLAGAHQRVRERKGAVTEYRKELCRRKVPRQLTLIAPSEEDPDGEPGARAQGLGARAPERPDEDCGSEPEGEVR